MGTVDSAESFFITGTSKQVDKSHALLQQSVHQSNGIVVLNNVRGEGIRSQNTEESESRLDNEVGHEGEANQDGAMLAAAIEA